MQVKHRFSSLVAAALVLSALLFSTRGFATESKSAFEKKFRRCGTEIPVKLRQLGYSGFGAFYLREIEDRVSQIEVVPADARKIGRMGDDGRLSGRSDGTRLFVDPRRIRQFPELCSVFALHEFLWFTRLNEDRHYQVSTRLWLLTQPQMHLPQLAEQKRRVEAELSSLLRVRYAGGVGGVGGGGELVTLKLRTDRMAKSASQIALAQTTEQRAWAEDQFDMSLQSVAEVIYPEAMSTKAQRRYGKAARRMLSRPRCLVSTGSCPIAQSHAFAGPCVCPGSSEYGVVIFEGDDR